MAAFSGPEINNLGLVLHLDAANIKSYPGTGTVWTDLSGQGNHVDLYNTPTFANGSFTFDGINEYARTTNNLNLSGTNAVTILYSTKVTSYPSSGTPYVVFELSENFNSYNDSFVHAFNDNSVGQNYQIIISVKGNTGYNIASYDKTVLNDLLWHSIAVVHDTSQSAQENIMFNNGNAATVVVNPVGGYASNNSNNFGNRLLYICSRAGAGSFSPVTLNNFLLFNRRLNEIEIIRIYNAFRDRFGI